MRHSFLYKLYNYSKKGFFCCLLFLVLYAFLLVKQMDMMLFPHNSMFAGYVANKKITTYCLKINGRILPVTQKMWWKKDFLESNAAVYGRYIEEGRQTLLENFITGKIKDTAIQKFFVERLTAGNIDPGDWALFYTTFAGHAIQTGDEAELVKYELKFEDNSPVVIDSLSIFKFRQP